MKMIIEKIIALFLVIIFVTFLVRHGKIDFSWLDKTIEKGVEVYNSEETQSIVNEVKDIALDVAHELTTGTKELIEKYKKSSEKAGVSLVRIVDGDTIVVNINGEEATVRLIGIDTPESVNPDESKNCEYGILASEHTKTLLENASNLYLEFDESVEDIHGRLLAYVWLTDSTSMSSDNVKKYMLNAMILNDGYAIDKVYEPNSKYAGVFASIKSAAKKNKSGLWVNDDFEDCYQ